MTRPLFGCALLTLPLWLACVDLDGKFDAFVERTQQPETPEPDAAPPPPPGDGGESILPDPERVTGSYLSVVSTNISPKKPVVYRLDVMAKRMGLGLELTLQDQPLSIEDRRTPVGDKSATRTVPVNPNGSYTETLKNVVTPGEANPVFPGTPTRADTTFNGRIDTAEADPATGDVTFWCGSVEGELYEPLAMEFTGTFTISRINGDDYPDAVINCAKDPADPL